MKTENYSNYQRPGSAQQEHPGTCISSTSSRGRSFGDRSLLTFALATAMFAGLIGRGRVEAGNDVKVVDSAPTLHLALTEANSGDVIILRKGTYPVTFPIVVPDGVSLEGEGVMLGNEHPTWFDPATETRIVAAAPMGADLVTLGDGAILKGLIIENAVGSLSGRDAF